MKAILLTTIAVLLYCASLYLVSIDEDKLKQQKRSIGRITYQVLELID